MIVDLEQASGHRDQAGRVRAAFLGEKEKIAQVYRPAARRCIAAQATVLPDVVSTDLSEEGLTRLRDADVIFSTWGMPNLTHAQLDRLPNLRALFYAAGSVQNFARPLLERGISVVSAWRANAIPVAEFTLSQILLSGKGYFRNVREYRDQASNYGTAFRGPGNYGESVALLGAGVVARSVIDMLKPFGWQVLVYDPFLTEGEANALGVEQVSLDQEKCLSMAASKTGLRSGLLRRMAPQRARPRPCRREHRVRRPCA